MLAARNPRLTGHDLHDVAAADQLAAWAVAVTAAHQESAAKIEGIARTSRIRALIGTHPERDALLAAIGADLWTAQAAAGQFAQLARSERGLHRPVHSMFDGPASGEQMEEIMAVVNAHLPAAADTSAALGAHLETAAESTIGYFCNPALRP